MTSHFYLIADPVRKGWPQFIFVQTGPVARGPCLTADATENMEENMRVTTTPNIEGHRISKYFGLVSGEAIMGANIFKDLYTRVCAATNSSNIL